MLVNLSSFTIFTFFLQISRILALGSVCPGDSACKRVEAEQQLAQAAEKEKTLVEKLTQSERQARVTLNKMEEIHRDQLETERQKHVQRLTGRLRHYHSRRFYLSGEVNVSICAGR